MDELTVKEAIMLANWLRSNGHISKQTIACIQYISGADPPHKQLRITLKYYLIGDLKYGNKRDLRNVQ